MTLTSQILATVAEVPATAREVSAELDRDFEVVCALMGQLANRGLLEVVGVGWIDHYPKPRLFQASIKGKVHARL